MDSRELLLRVLQAFTQINLLFGAVSVVSAVISWLTLGLGMYQQVSYIPAMIRDLLFTGFVSYWEFWFLLAGPPIIGYLKISREDPRYWGLTLTNLAPVLVLYVIKILYGFMVPGII
jgi:hypothetical protein